MKVGMRQLSDIYDTYIYLSSTYFDESLLDTFGIVEYVGTLSVEEAGLELGTVCSVYNLSEEDSLDEFE